MPLASTAKLTEHFTAFELGADRPEATTLIISNLRITAEALERVRATLGVPLIANTPAELERGFRPNPTPRSSPTSDHFRGLAGDVVPFNYAGGMFGAYNALRAARDAGTLGAFDQIILYPLQGHIHVGVGERLRGEFRVYVYEGSGGVPLITADTISALGGLAKSSPLLALLLLIVSAFALVTLIA